MRLLPRTLIALLTLAGTTAAIAKEKAHEEVLLLDSHRVTIVVPEGFVFSSGRDEQGVLMAKVADAKEKIDLQVRFQTDPGGRLRAEPQQMEFLATVCRQYAEGSVEKGYDFKALEPHQGSGTYCSFTDASLVGRLPVPRGEFLHITQGVKCSSGWVLVFTLLSNDTDSREYHAALKLLKESFEEPPQLPTKS